MMNFVRAQNKKAADETETILETTRAGKSDGEGALRAFIKRQGQRLRRLSNLVGCRDPEYVSPQRSRSATPSNPNSGHSDPLEDEDVGVVTQEADDDMTLGTFQVRSAYMLKTRQGINKYTPEDFTETGNRTVGTSRMAALDDYVDQVDEEMEPELERVPLPRKAKAKKIAKRKGEEPKSAQGTSLRTLFVM
ncbi:hypothetical protein VPH35_101715 [Triticum aestivum]